MNIQFDFYAPYQLPDGRIIYGAAAANRRAADAGGFNQLAYQLVVIGLNMGHNHGVAQQQKHHP